ncbi:MULTISPECIES: hypothetical protein [unclassified Mesorhizobium]|uniref:hypothetical protein n=1 Tax=unclassified Mesorhizobium TaxID=325217 RepID=UPI00333DC657
MLLIIFVLTACSPSGQVEQQSETAASATQTASLVLESWIAGEAPSRYTSRTLQSVGQALADAGAQIQSAKSPEPSGQAGLTMVVGRLSATVMRATTAVQNGNRSEVEQAQQDLRAAAADLSTSYAKHFAPKS